MSFAKKFAKFGADSAEVAKKEELAALAADEGLNPEQDLDLQEAIRDFRLSISAWSEAAYNRPRVMVELGRRRRWRLAAGWALGCVVVIAGASGGIYEHLHQQQEVVWNQHLQQEARVATTRVAEDEQLASEQRGQRVHKEEEDLLAKVDSDVSRQVPSAMEPLAQLMTEDETE
jgi:hypothetical protein